MREKWKKHIFLWITLLLIKTKFGQTLPLLWKIKKLFSFISAKWKLKEHPYLPPDIPLQQILIVPFQTDCLLQRLHPGKTPKLKSLLIEWEIFNGNYEKLIKSIKVKPFCVLSILLAENEREKHHDEFRFLFYLLLLLLFSFALNVYDFKFRWDLSIKSPS